MGRLHQYFLGKELFTYFIRVDGAPAYSFITALFFAGEDGVAAVSIIMYLQFLFIGVYFGFSMGMAPVLSYAYGKGYFSGLITFLRSFALLLLFLSVLPQKFDLTGVWLAVPAAESLTLLVSVWFLRPIHK